MTEKFSQRHGYECARAVAQVEGMDDALRNGLWNCIVQLIVELNRMGTQFFVEFAETLWDEFFNRTTDDVSYFPSEAASQIREWFMGAPWYRVYDLVEYLAATQRELVPCFSRVMTREMAGYRIVGSRVVPIVAEEEIDEVEGVLRFGPGPVAEHIRAAVEALASRDNPNYRESVHESISAVEAAVRSLTGDSKALLPEGLRALNIDLHPALSRGFISLYGYTSDEGGIRHALTEDARPIDLADARYMLVACSAFVNYMRVKAERELA